MNCLVICSDQICLAGSQLCRSQCPPMPTAIHSSPPAWLLVGCSQTPKCLMRLGTSMVELSPKGMVMVALLGSYSCSQASPLQYAQAHPQ